MWRFGPDGLITDFYVETFATAIRAISGSSDNWLSLLDSAKKRGVEIEEFQVSRHSVTESEFHKEHDKERPDDLSNSEARVEPDAAPDPN